MKRKRITKKPKHGQLNPADRLSALPDNVVYRIISFLGFKQACRTSILSKRWKYISDTNPDMELSNELFSAVPGVADAYIKVDSFLKYVENRMERYSNQKLHIKKLTLGFPIQRMPFLNTMVLLEDKVKQWVTIAVCNQVEELVLIGPVDYAMSDILFTAKLLRCLDCSYLVIYDYIGFDLFPSLESLFLHEVSVDDPMLNHIISYCRLLKHLKLSSCYGFDKSIKSIVIPCNSKLETLDLSKSLCKDEGTVTIDTFSLTSFQYIGGLRRWDIHGGRWPVISKDDFLRNLRILKIGFVTITDEVLGKLLSELVLLENLKLCNCSMLKTFRFSSSLLKEVRLEHCADLLDVKIDVPCLETFKYKGDFKPSVWINRQAGCDISLHIPPSSFRAENFSKMKELLKGLRDCHILKIVLLDEPAKPDKDGFFDINLGEEKLADTYLGPPCDIRELKLTLSSWVFCKSYLSVLLDGVFWTCHPRIFSIRANLRAPNRMIEALVSKLNEMANCWKHPLKRVEVEGANFSDLLKTRKLDVQLRLHW